MDKIVQREREFDERGWRLKEQELPHMPERRPEVAVDDDQRAVAPEPKQFTLEGLD